MLKFDRPTLITITAPSGSGKSYLLDTLDRRGAIRKIVSTTTRAPRANEVEGRDYYFISEEQSRAIEDDGKFFELITFQGIRYGVLQSEMQQKMAPGPAPVVLLEPSGLREYQKACRQHGWDIFQVYVHVTESVRIDRLNARTIENITSDAIKAIPVTSRYADALNSSAGDILREKIKDQVLTHTKRLTGIMTDERTWSNKFEWDAIVPGDDVEQAIKMLEQGVAWRNKRLADVRS